MAKRKSADTLYDPRTGGEAIQREDSAKAYLQKRPSSVSQSKVVVEEERLLTASAL